MDRRHAWRQAASQQNVLHQNRNLRRKTAQSSAENDSKKNKRTQKNAAQM
jgi:hypothetical protein